MSRRLVIFSSSTRPDPYLNVILYANRQLGVDDILLVSVEESKRPAEPRLADLSADMSRLVAELANGRYWTRAPDGEETVPLEVPTVFADALERFDWDRLTIARRAIREQDLESLIAAEAHAGSAFDVTTARNSIVASVVALVVARGGSPIYTFELLKQQTFTADDLLPALMTGDFEYRDLSLTPALGGAVRRVNRYSLTRRRMLLLSIGLAIAFGLATRLLAESTVLLVLTVLASFASIMSALTFFMRE